MKEVNGSIWHTMSTQRVTPTDFVCVIEISKGSKNKYELDKETGLRAGTAHDFGKSVSYRRDLHAGQR